MGLGLVEVAARAGHQVTVRSRSVEAAEQLVAQLTSRLDRDVARGRIEPDERAAVLDRVSTTTLLADLKSCDLVIESVVEDLSTKQALFAELGDLLPAEAILASNTSTLPITALAAATAHPERVCGIHFFNPAPAMRLVEVVQPPTADDRTIAAAVAFAESCGKEPIVVQDHAGFVVNALLFPYLNNAVRMWERGTASLEAIDAAMQGGCNFPMGPFSLLDLVGLDTSLAILETLYADRGDESCAPCETLRAMVAAGNLGRKTGKGFFEY
jgi:3-hydroxybutyryl-CoA dehydrogenase